MAFRIGVFIIGALVAFPLWANPIEIGGELIRRGNQFALRTADDVVWPLHPASYIIEEDLRELYSGDLLHVTLERPDEDSDFVLTEIHYLQVCRLMGLWVAEDFSVVNIASLDELLIRPNVPMAFQDAQSYVYTLTPEEGPGWGVFLAQPGRVLTGQVQFDGAALRFRIWEKSTIKFNFYLTPLHQTSRPIDHCT